jgi:hypothetical protein
MKLGISGDKIIDTFPNKIIKLAQDTLKNNGRVFIITKLSSQDSRSKLLDLMSIYIISKPFWSQIYSIPDWAKQKNIPHWFDINGEFNFLREKDFYITKNNIVEELGLDLYLDDCEDSVKYFKPGVFCLMKTKR